MENKTIQDEIFIRLVKRDGEYRIGEYSGSNAVETNMLVFEIDRLTCMYNRDTRERAERMRSIEEDICACDNNPRNAKAKRIERYFKMLNQRSNTFPVFTMAPPPPEIEKKSEVLCDDPEYCILDTLIKVLRDALKDSIRCKQEEIELQHLRYYRDTSVGLWCIDKNPKDVSHSWIIKNAFHLDDVKHLKKRV